MINRRSLMIHPIPAALLACLCLSAGAAERELADYQTLLKITHLDKVYEFPAEQRDKLVIRGNMKPRNATIRPEEVRLFLVDGGETTRLPVSADGGFDLKSDPRWLKANPMIYTSLAADEKSAFSFSARPTLPDGLRFSYASLMTSVRQMNAMMRAGAGPMRFFMPTFSGVELQFPATAAPTLELQTRDGVRQLRADAQSRIRLKLDEALLAANAQILLSARPLAADFLTD
jgi:hypothetical protein